MVQIPTRDAGIKHNALFMCKVDYEREIYTDFRARVAFLKVPEVIRRNENAGRVVSTKP